MLAILTTSFREALKKKIIALIGLLTLIYLVLYGLFVYYVRQSLDSSHLDAVDMFAQYSSIITLIGFYFSSMIVAFLTIMASVGAVSSELESGVVHSIVTKPLRRVEYVMGKFLGLALLLLAFSTVMYLSDIIIPWAMGIPSMDIIGLTPMLKGLLLFLFEPLVILSLSFYGSVSFKTLNNGIFVISLYILGTIGGMVEQISNILSSSTVEKWGILSSLVSPFDVIYRRMITEIFSSFSISPQTLGPMFLAKSTPSIWMMVYAFAYSAFFLFLAVRKFSRKDLS